jgi:3-(methylthio)propanoyl-CoA dehydrogenase
MITKYAAPIDDIVFALQLVGCDVVDDMSTVADVLDGFGRFCAEVVAPLNQVGDAAGVEFDPVAATVTTAPGWKEAYARYVEAGWNSVSFSAESGGGGLPWLVTTAMQEQLNASSMAFALGPMLTQGAVHMIERHGSPKQRASYLPGLVSGGWTGTMNLTEPGAGSDVGAVVARATRAGDDAWRITGQKIFITYGEHDLSDQIIHLVLARTEGAPPGTRGISCFIVPKVLADGTRNALRCIGVEDKMGIHASPTCTLQFDGALGEIIGGEHGGMQAMFTMMNNARLSVGVEGLGVAVRAHQAAVTYAKERVQGRVADRPTGTPIIGHPDVRRMLVHSRSHIEAMRLLAYRTAVAIDTGDTDYADLLTPITKAWCTDTGADVARLATQVVGGMGYIRETGVEQFERDVRIAAIYEGTNGIQAVDLVARKLNVDGGHAIARLISEVRATAEELGGTSGSSLLCAADALSSAKDHLRDRWPTRRRDALAGATPFLRLAGATVGGWLLARQAIAARSSSNPRSQARSLTAAFFIDQVVPSAAALLPAITAGADVFDALGDEEL